MYNFYVLCLTIQCSILSRARYYKAVEIPKLYAMEVADGNERSKKRYVIIFLSWTRLTDLFETLWKYVLLIFINFESFMTVTTWIV